MRDFHQGCCDAFLSSVVSLSLSLSLSLSHSLSLEIESCLFSLLKQLVVRIQDYVPPSALVWKHKERFQFRAKKREMEVEKLKSFEMKTNHRLHNKKERKKERKGDYWHSSLSFSFVCW